MVVNKLNSFSHAAKTAALPFCPEIFGNLPEEPAINQNRGVVDGGRPPKLRRKMEDLMPARPRKSPRPSSWTPGGQDFIDRTLEVWQPYRSHPLTREDAREISRNVIGFFALLLEWRAAELQEQPSGSVPEKRGSVAK